MQKKMDFWRNIWIVKLITCVMKANSKKPIKRVLHKVLIACDIYKYKSESGEFSSSFKIPVFSLTNRIFTVLLSLVVLL